MKVLVTGASGYIGGAVAKTLSERGHLVYGLYRSASSLPFLLQHEIIPVNGTAEKREEWEEVLKEVEVVVDVATSSALAAHNTALFHRLDQIGKETKRKKRYIYTSGCLTCGEVEVAKEVKDEEDLLIKVHANYKWRRDLEFSLIAKKRDEEEGGAAAVVVRPGFVYGGTGGHYAVKWFQMGERNEIKVIGNPNKRWGWVHVNDLAEAIALVTEAPSSIVEHQIFNITDDSRYRFEEIVVSMARAAGGVGEVQYIPDSSSDPFHSFIDLDSIVSSEKIKRTLHWSPRHPPFLDRVHLYYQSYRSFNPSS